MGSHGRGGAAGVHCHRESESAIRTAASAWRQGQRPRTREGSSRLSHRGSDALPRIICATGWPLFLRLGFIISVAPSFPRSATPAAPAIPAAPSPPAALPLLASIEFAHQEYSTSPIQNFGLVEVTAVVGISIQMHHYLSPQTFFILY